MLERVGCDPLEAMARLAVDEKQDMTLRFQAMKELAHYVAAKRKAIEHSGDSEQPMRHVFKWQD